MTVSLFFIYIWSNRQRWSGQSVFHVPTLFHAPSKSANLHIIFFCPFSHGLGYAIHRIYDIMTGVPHLLLFSRPSDIRRTVISTVINSVQLTIRKWRASNITKKFNKVFVPFFTHLNTSTAVIRIRKGAGIFTSIFHAKPAFIHWMRCVFTQIVRFNHKRDYTYDS
jgi:hypothetical protein